MRAQPRIRAYFAAPYRRYLSPAAWHTSRRTKFGDPGSSSGGTATTWEIRYPGYPGLGHDNPLIPDGQVSGAPPSPGRTSPVSYP